MPSAASGLAAPITFFEVLRAKVVTAGATVVTDRVVDLAVDGSVVQSVALGSGRVVPADAVVNCASTWAAGLAAKVGMPLPVEPMRRHEH